MEKIKLKQFTSEKNIKDKGIYLIEHLDTNIKYIGSTKLSFQERWRSHLNGFKRGVGNVVLLNIYKKYGINNFKFSILESLNDSDEKYIRKRERFWIEYYDTYKNGANCSLETECAFINFDRKPYNEIDRLKYLLSSPSKKKVYLYDKYGNLIYIFPSSVSCDRFLGLPKRRTNWAINHPLKCLKKEYFPSYENKKWCPLEEMKKIRCLAAKKASETRKKNGTYIMTENQKQKIRENNSIRKKVALYDLNGNFIKEFLSLNECDDYLELCRGTTSKVFRGLVKTLRKKYIPKLI